MYYIRVGHESHHRSQLGSTLPRFIWQKLPVLGNHDSGRRERKGRNKMRAAAPQQQMHWGLKERRIKTRLLAVTLAGTRVAQELSHSSSNNKWTLLVSELETLIVLIAMITHIRHVNDVDWWVNTGATCCICSLRDLFISYEPLEGVGIMMGNFSKEADVSKGQSSLTSPLTNWTFIGCCYMDYLHLTPLSAAFVSNL